MFSTYIFLKSFVLTLTILLAIGPVCLTLINNLLTKSMAHGIASAFGVCFMDYLYIIFSVLFIHKIESSMKNGIFFDLLGCFILFYLSFQFLTQKEVSKSKSVTTSSPLKTFFTMFILTGSSPTTVIAYAGLFASISVKLNNPFSAILGGMLGTTVFYTILSYFVLKMKSKIEDKHILMLSKIGGLIIFSFAINSLFKIITNY